MPYLQLILYLLYIILYLLIYIIRIVITRYFFQKISSNFFMRECLLENKIKILEIHLVI